MLAGVSLRGHRLVALVMSFAMLVAMVPFNAASAQPTPTLNWMGQDWHVEGSGTATVNGAGHAVIERTAGTSDVYLHVNRIAPTDVNDVSWINQYGTPWVEVTWVDNGQDAGVDVFIDDESNPSKPRLQFGSLWACEGVAWLKYGSTIEETVVEDEEDCTAGSYPGTRTAGDVHTMYVGKRADGTIDFQYDGVWHTSTLHVDANITDFEFGDVFLRLRGPLGTSATFQSVTYGDDHDGSQVVTGTLPQLVEVTPIRGSASTVLGVRRTLMTLALMIEAFAENEMPGFACLQSRVFDLQVFSQVSKRRIAPADARVLLDQTAEIRSSLGCGGGVG